MKFRTVFMTALGACVLPAWPQSEEPVPELEPLSRDTLRRALKGAKILYRDDVGEFSSAAEAFQAVESAGDDQEFNLDALRLAQGLSRLRADDPEGALEALSCIQGFQEADQRSRHRLLKGVAHLQKGAALAEEAQWDPAIQEAQNGIDSLSESLKDNPDSEVARTNLELAHKQLQDYLARRPPPTPTPTPEPTPEPSPTPEASPTPTPEPTPTPDPENEEGQEPTPTPDPEGEENQENQQDQGDQNQEEQQDDQQDQSQSDESQQQEGDASDAQSGEGQERSQEELEAEQARQILDAYQEQEKAQRRELLQRRIRGIPVEKDW